MEAGNRHSVTPVWGLTGGTTTAFGLQTSAKPSVPPGVFLAMGQGTQRARARARKETGGTGWWGQQT